MRVFVSKADSIIAGEIVEPSMIDISAQINPDGEVQTVREQAEFYDAEAERIFRALKTSLPGGTLDRLTAKLLILKASSLRVKFPETEV